MKKKNHCLDCGLVVYGQRCKLHACQFYAKTKYARHLIDLSSLKIDKQSFTAVDANGVKLPIYLKFDYKCDKCDKIYHAALSFERKKIHPWHCKSCAIHLEWKNDDYRQIHIETLTLAANTVKNKERLSKQSRLNWENLDTRKKMLTRNQEESSRKNKITRHANLLSGKTKFKQTHGKRILVGSNWMRSTYESRFAILLNQLNICWVYEPKWFDIGDSKAYLPDFFIPSLDLYVEIKGWWRDDAKEKFDAFVRLNPNINYALIMRSELESLEK